MITQELKDVCSPFFSKVLNLVWSLEDKAFEFVPVGTSPRNNERSKRLARGYVVAQKTLSTDSSEHCFLLMENHWPVLCRCHGLVRVQGLRSRG